MPDDRVPNLITALKACAEMCGILMKHLVDQGFSRGEALTLTKAYLQTITRPQSKEEKQNGELEF